MRHNNLLVAALAAALLALHANVATAGGISSDCTDSSNWGAHSSKLDDATTAPLSGCQESILGVTPDDDIDSKYKIGGKGSADIVGISAGSKAGGCTSVTDCMAECQALCCLSSGCKYAQIWQHKTSDDYVVYTKTVYKWYCELYSAGSYTKSDTCTNCQASSTANCASIVSDQLGLNSTYYTYLKAVAAYSTCPTTSGRRLLSADPTVTAAATAATAIGGRQLHASSAGAAAAATSRRLLADPPVLPEGLKLLASEAIDKVASLKDLTLGEIEIAIKKAAMGHSFLEFAKSRLNKKCAAIAKRKPCATKCA